MGIEDKWSLQSCMRAQKSPMRQRRLDDERADQALPIMCQIYDLRVACMALSRGAEHGESGGTALDDAARAGYRGEAAA